MSAGVSLQLDAAAMEPLIRRVVAETITAMQADQAKLGDKLAYTEQEAARLLDLEPWHLRDERREGKIKASQVRGGRIRYTKDDLLAYLAGRRWGAR